MSSFNSALPSLGESELDSDARVALFLDTTTGSDAWRAFKSTVLFTGCVACFSSSFPQLDLLDAKEGLPFLPFGDFPPFFSLLAFFKSSRGMRAFRSKISYLACRAANASSEMSSSEESSLVLFVVATAAESTLFARLISSADMVNVVTSLTDGVLMSSCNARSTYFARITLPTTLLMSNSSAFRIVCFLALLFPVSALVVLLLLSFLPSFPGPPPALLTPYG
mmetsp:Transcript_8768/g.25526  ORF Transcript_8768/g.25526 Transcript_8768/m.25526 type:complete len:223 (+) Transcript_8768:141-809(+)